MRTVIWRQCVDGSSGAVVRIKKGEVLFVTKLIPPNTNQFAQLARRTSDGMSRLDFTSDVAVNVLNFDAETRTAEHVLFVRRDRSNVLGINFAKPNGCPLVREAFTLRGLPIFKALDGFANALVFPDEFAAQESRSSGWIVPKYNVGGYMSVLASEQGMAASAV